MYFVAQIESGEGDVVMNEEKGGIVIIPDDILYDESGWTGMYSLFGGIDGGMHASTDSGG